MRHGTYNGPVKHLRGKTALLQDHLPEKLLAQFDDIKLVEAFGWHEYPAADFTFDPKLED